MVFPKEKFKNDYLTPWKEETLELMDTMYSILRTVYRRQFGEAFHRVVIFGFTSFPTGQVQNFKELLAPI